MSKIIAQAAIRGSHAFYKEAEEFFNKAVEEKGEDQKIEFPETAYFLPMANALMGVEVKNPFPTYPHGFPKEVLDELKQLTGYDVQLMFIHSGGIAENGEQSPKGLFAQSIQFLSRNEHHRWGGMKIHPAGCSTSLLSWRAWTH